MRIIVRLVLGLQPVSLQGCRDTVQQFVQRAVVK